jgi:hypothetical protein
VGYRDPLDIAIRCPLLFFECASLPDGEELSSIKSAEELDQFRDDTGPAGLVAGPKARAVVSVKILVEQNVIPPVRIGLEFLRAAVNRTPSGLIA